MAIGIVGGTNFSFGAAKPDLAAALARTTAVYAYSGTVWGSPIPISQGYRKITGVPLWGGPIVKDNVRQVTINPPWPQATLGGIVPMPADQMPVYTSWELKRSFAVGLGYRLSQTGVPPKVRQIWADGTLIYSNGVGQPLNWNGLTQDYLPTGQYVNGVWIPNPDAQNINLGGSGPFPAVVNENGLITGNALPRVGLQSTLQWRFHDGQLDQDPDQAIAADLGELAMSYPLMMYLVFDGLIVGKGFSKTVSGELEVENANAYPTLPVITVELVDGDESVSFDHPFTYLDNSPGFGAPDHVVATNWDTREALVLHPAASGGGGYLHTYDLDGATETSSVFVPGLDGDDYVGGLGENTAWDKINDVVYTQSSDRPFVSVTKGGSVVSRSFQPSPFGGQNIDGSQDPADWTPAKPCIKWGNAGVIMEVTHALRVGEVWPVLGFGSFGVMAFLGPSLGGDVPSSLLGTAAIDPAAHGLPTRIDGIQAFPLFQKGLEARVLSQDAAFLVTWSKSVTDTVQDTVGIVFCTVDPNGSTSRVTYTGIQTLFVSSSSATNVVGFLDGNGDVVIQETNGAVPARFRKYKVNYVKASETTVSVPGFQGVFPQVSAVPTLVVDNDLSGASFNMPNVKSVSNSLLTANTMILPSNRVMDLNTGLQSDPTGFINNSSGHAWDSTNGLYFYYGSAPRNMRYEQAIGGVNGETSLIEDVVKGIAEYRTVGFQEADIQSTIAAAKVPGVLITKPYVLTTLFNSLGALFNFTYFNSGGHLKFANASLNPTKATADWTITALPADGNTATVGTSVYRFKTVPAAPFDVKIEPNTSVDQPDGRERTLQNFFAALKADISFAASDNGFFPGTVKNDKVDPKIGAQTTNWGVLVMQVVAANGGVAGNSIATTVGGGVTAFHFSGTHLAGGSEPPEPSVTITLDQLAFVQEQQLNENDAIVTEINPAGQSQTSAQVNYYALEQDYALTSQKFIPDNQGGEINPNDEASVVYDTPLVLSTSDAYARVAKTAFATADGVTAQYFRLPQAFMTVEPADVVKIQVREFEYLIRIDEATLNGDFSTSFSAQNYSYRTDVTFQDSDAHGAIPQNVALGSDAYPFVLDAPELSPLTAPATTLAVLPTGVRSVRTGFSLANFSAGKVVDANASLTWMYSTSLDTKWGTATGLPAAVEPYYRTVEDSVTIACRTLSAGDFASAGSYQDFVAGVNCLAVGTSSGGWEYIYFRDVTVLGDKTVKLTGLIRAQRGTDAFVDHSDPKTVAVLVASAAPDFVFRSNPDAVFWPISEVGSTYRYSVLGEPASRGALTEDVPLKDYALYPFSPCQLKAQLAAGNDLNLSWSRRDRRSTAFVTSPPPMSEASERYDLEILSGAVVVRTVSDLTTPAYTYTSAAQTTDGFTPPLASLSFRVYQKGQLGRGFPRKEDVDVH